MKKVFIILFSILVYFSFNKNINAYPYLGGEIGWECLQTGEFQFVVKLYNECSNSVGFMQNFNLQTNHPAGNINVSLVNNWPKEISPVCNSNTNFYHISCSNSTSSIEGAVSEYLYKSAPVRLSGIPPNYGWEFSLHNLSPRNIATNIDNSVYQSVTLRAKMYPYYNWNTYVCYDNSPEFLHAALPVANINNTAVIINSAYDVDLDSLAYELAPSLQSNGTSVVYDSNYNYFNPFHGIYSDSNNYYIFDHKTGILEITSNLSGQFVYVTKVSAYKCGVLVSETYREMLIVLRDDTINNPPNLNIDNGAYTHNDIIEVYVGDTVEIDISATDFDSLSSSPFIPTTLSMDAYSNILGEYIPATQTSLASMSTTTGCFNPPCAILDPPISIEYPMSNISTLTTKLKWMPLCNALSTSIGCGATSNSFDFVFRVWDDYCPVPNYTIKKITLNVLVKPSLNPPKNLCIKRNKDSITLVWNKAIDSLDNFSLYKVYKHLNGQDYIIDSIPSINDTSLAFHLNYPISNVKYRVGVVSNPFHTCHYKSIKGEKFSPIFLKAYQISGSKTMLNWNAPLSTLPSNYTDYYVYKSTSANNWSLITTTSNTSFMDTLSHNIDSVRYRVEISNSVCTSISNEAIILPSGIEESDLSEKIKIYPNPAKDFLKLEWEADLKIELVEIYNTSSQLILKKEIRSSDRNALIELKDLSKGIYIVILKGEGLNYLEKVLLE